MRVFYQTLRHLSMSTRRPSPEYWREAATLVVAAPDNSSERREEPSSSDRPFNILMLKRGSSSPFMPDGYVYPGGCISDADFDRSTWRKIFEKVTGLPMDVIEASQQPPGPRVSMLKSNRHWTDSVCPDVAFKMCALRETFEESGLLFVSHKEGFPGKEDPKRRLYSRGFPRKIVPPMYDMPDSFDVVTWRQRVSSDPAAFSALCEEFDVVPNVWALFEWSNWLTPAMKKIDKPPPKPKRYDTMFYVCCLDSQPDGAEACTDETTVAEWRTPRMWLAERAAERIQMFGPQMYECDRLSVFHSLGKLATYVNLREPQGMIKFFPVPMSCQDGFAFVLPGDEKYPENPDFLGVRDMGVVSQSTEEFVSSGHLCHRANLNERGYVCTVDLPCGLFTNPSGSKKKDSSGSDPWASLSRATKHNL